MAVRGLDDYRLTVDSLARLGAAAVAFSVQLRGIPLPKLTPLSPRERDSRLRATLKNQLTRVARRFPEADLRSRNPKKGSWTLDGRLPASHIRRFALQPEVADVWIEEIVGRSRRRRAPRERWFCVWGVVAIQIEGQRSGTIEIEDRLVLLKAYDFQDAEDRLRPEWEQYAEPYLNPNGYLVRRQLMEIKDVFSVHDEELSPKGTEVYSRLRTVKMKPAYRWQGSRRG
jgi:hypothetical protein